MGWHWGILAASGAAGTYELIESTILTGTQASITFSNLGNYSSTYKHLQLRVVARNNLNDFFGRLRIRLNGDTGSNYSVHQLTGNGSAVSSSAAANVNGVEIGQVSGNTQPSGVFSPTIIDILDCYSTSKNKTIRSLTGQNGSGGETFVHLFSGARYNTAALTSIDLDNVHGTAFVSGSRFSLYGIKG